MLNHLTRYVQVQEILPSYSVSCEEPALSLLDPERKRDLGGFKSELS